MALTTDKALANQKLRQMSDDSGEVCFKAINIFVPEHSIFFHFIQTGRDNLAASGSGNNRRLLRNIGSYLLWQHVYLILYHDDSERVVYRTKLRNLANIGTDVLMKIRQNFTQIKEQI